MQKYRIILIVTLIIFAGLSSPLRTFAADERCFPQTGKCISGAIRAYWEANGGLAVFGYPITNVANQDNGEGFSGPTQWFERDRLELHGNGNVLAGRLGASELALSGRPWEGFAKVGSAGAGCRFFPETGHSLCQPFLGYWEANGGLERFGYPVSEVGTETLASGWSGRLQWFERRRMELHPENQPPYDVLLGLLGNELVGHQAPASRAAPAPSAPASPASDIVRRVVDRTNAYRQQNGCPALTLNVQLINSAQAHSVDMAQNDFFGHTGSDGSSFDQRITRAGYNFRRAAENIAAGYATPEEVVDGWFNESPPNDGHRLNILNCALREIGVGYVYLPNDPGSVTYQYYWTQDLGAR